MRPTRPRPVLAPRPAFVGFCFPSEVIVLAVRWYLRYGLSYRDVRARSTTGAPTTCGRLPPCPGPARTAKTTARRFEIGDGYRRWPNSGDSQVHASLRYFRFPSALPATTPPGQRPHSGE